MTNTANITVSTINATNAFTLLMENGMAAQDILLLSDVQKIEKAKALFAPRTNAFVVAAKSANAVRGSNPHSLNSPKLLERLKCADATELKELLDGCVATVKSATAVKASTISLNPATEAKAKKNALAAGVNWKDVQAFKVHLSISIPIGNATDGEVVTFDYKSESLLSDSIESLIDVTGAEIGSTCKLSMGDVIGNDGERQTVWIKGYTAV